MPDFHSFPLFNLPMDFKRIRLYGFQKNTPALKITLDSLRNELTYK